MALGDLSADARRFAASFAAATGLRPDVVVAWVGTESGWGTTKASRNYLNVGPGEAYPSTDAAVARTARLLNESPRYAAIRAAIPAGGPAQVRAIGASAWGTNAALLDQVYRQLQNRPLPLPALATAAPKEPDGVVDRARDVVDRARDVVDDALDGGLVDDPAAAVGRTVAGVGGFVGDRLAAVVDDAAAAALTVVFTVAALGLIALGLSRLTARPAGRTLDDARTLAGLVPQVARFAR